MKGNLHLIKDQFDRSKFAVRKIITAKEFSDLNYNQAVIGKISIFQEIAPNFTYSQKLLLRRRKCVTKMAQDAIYCKFKNVIQSIQKNIIIDCIKCSGQIQQHHKPAC